MAFKNKVALITGSGSGIGQETAIIFAKKGAQVVIVDWNEEGAKNTAEKCKQYGNKVLVIKTDVSKAEDVNKAIEKTIEEFGKLDILVNNAGIIKPGKIVTGEIMNSFDQIMNVNLRGVVLFTSLAVPHLIKAKGCIVNTSSISSKFVQKACDFPAYSISKAGVDAFTRLSALELAPSGVRVNAVNPGPVFTNLLSTSGIEPGFKDYEAWTALGRSSDPSEIANLIVYLASDKAKSITGSTYLIDNGMSLL